MTLELIVNADDFGLTAAVNRGIIEAHRNGIVTSASLLATGAAFEDAVQLARATPTLAIGVHLALCGQRPLSAADQGSSLVTTGGELPGDVFRLAARLLRRRVAASEIERELDAQVQRVRDSGLAIGHLDGHQHVHVLPGVAAIVARLARAYGIAKVRYPAEPLRGFALRHPRRLAEQLALRAASAAVPLRGLRRADSLAGFPFAGRLDEANLLTLLRRLPGQGRVELMCHPGHDDPASPYRAWRYRWRQELEALCSERVRVWLDGHGVRLVT
ncbi:MAG: ChbG/HpnK family deacetylase [Gammaproteobacteria bacterium]|nr:ChbG/HpnK family deacetylase [Gammaproteobacteria bacterium]